MKVNRTALTETLVTYVSGVVAMQTTTGRCSRCHNGAYLLDGLCVDECPAGMAWYGSGANDGRRCEKPFVCNKLFGFSTGEKCRCPGNCLSCEWRADVKDAYCLSCRNYRGIHDGKCVETCPETLIFDHQRSVLRACIPKITACHLDQNCQARTDCISNSAMIYFACLATRIAALKS